VRQTKPISQWAIWRRSGLAVQVHAWGSAALPGAEVTWKRLPPGVLVPDWSRLALKQVRAWISFEF